MLRIIRLVLIITSLNKLLILILNMKSYMHTMSSPIVGFPMVAWQISWLSWLFSRSQMSSDQGLSRSPMWLEDTTNQSVLPSTSYPIHLSQWATNQGIWPSFEMSNNSVFVPQEFSRQYCDMVTSSLKQSLVPFHLPGRKSPNTLHYMYLKSMTNSQRRTCSTLLAQANRQQTESHM